RQRFPGSIAERVDGDGYARGRGVWHARWSGGAADLGLYAIGREGAHEEDGNARLVVGEAEEIFEIPTLDDAVEVGTNVDVVVVGRGHLDITRGQDRFEPAQIRLKLFGAWRGGLVEGVDGHAVEGAGAERLPARVLVEIEEVKMQIQVATGVELVKHLHL